MTPVGVRDGDPDALAGLCDRRGPAVLAYCEVVAGSQAAAVAAAEAFGSFRAGVVATPDLANLNPEALLISATRHAAARQAGSDAPPDCARVPSLLAARADRSITLADHDWLGEHLASCWTCRAPVARFEAADRAYRDPPATRLDPGVAAAILAALNAAAPIAGEIPEPAAPAPVLPSDNGSTARAPREDAQAVPSLEAGPEGLGDQSTAWQTGVDDAGLDPATADAAQPPPDRAARRTVKIGGLSRRPRTERGAAFPMPASPTASAGESRTGGGTHLPRERRPSASAGGARHGVPVLRRGLVLPVVLVVLAIVVALLIAGVFGGNEPALTPQSFTPGSNSPAETTPAPVVVVPGSGDASAADVERAKARTRAAERRRAAAARKAAATTAATSVTAGPTPPATGDPATAAGDTATAPVQRQAPATSEKPKIDADAGATGAEQVEPPEDTLTVPDLAPPAEPADPPGQ